MLWLKAFHIIAMVCWFAGIFYLPRLFVYHAQSTDQATRDQFKIMERKLYRFITPLAVFTVLFGLALALPAWQFYLGSGWFLLKMLAVILLISYHIYCGYLLRIFAEDRNQRSHVFYRWFNELPVLILFAAVILAVLKPF